MVCVEKCFYVLNSKWNTGARNNVDFNTLTKTGLYRITGASCVNAPVSNAEIYGVCFVMNADIYMVQLHFSAVAQSDAGNHACWWRGASVGSGSPSWSAWSRL